LKKYGWNIVRIPEVMDKKSKDKDILAYDERKLKIPANVLNLIRNVL